ncbi:hypothetical protein [Candidatus Poriferisodalis sp.]|uniref:hypothetical protein n=1 Tax=Candidatus Poriferisodalis sp. TaxID=3101277 RepID=UPI003B027FF4
MERTDPATPTPTNALPSSDGLGALNAADGHGVPAGPAGIRRAPDAGEGGCGALAGATRASQRREVRDAADAATVDSVRLDSVRAAGTTACV